MKRWQATHSMLMFCGALASAACDDVLEGKKDQNDQQTTCQDDCSDVGGGSWHGGDGHDDTSDNNHGQQGDSGTGTGTDDREAPRVMLEDGEIEGCYTSSDVQGFLGIPYAKPPLDELRFAAPRAPEPWSELRQADRRAPSCIAAHSGSVLDPERDEDCLYLNVWAPANRAQPRLPVLVFFESAEPTSGADAAALYDGTQLAERGLVVVTVSYRVGLLGFLAHQRLADEQGGAYGNQGLWDQQQALRWVQANIDSFGGDADNVTIAGQGSSATDVCLHAVAPDSRGLFAQLILHSGGCTTYQPTAAQLQGRAQPWLDALSCDEADVPDCLRGKSLTKLLAALPSEAEDSFVPCVDGEFLPEQPRNLFDQAKIAQVNFLMGSNAEEGSVYYDALADIDTEQDYHDYMQAHFPGVSLSELCEVYPHDRFAGEDHPYQSALAYVLGDGRYVCSTLDTAIRARAAGVNVYLYNFDGPSPQDVGDAEHGAELAYLFGTMHSPDDAELTLSDSMQRYWVNFSHYGNPADGMQPMWLALGSKTHWRMNLGSELDLLKGFREPQCQLWRAQYDRAFGGTH